MKLNLSDFRRIDELGRLVIPKNICHSCNIKANDYLNVSCDESKQVIYIVKEKSKNYLSNISTKIFKPLFDKFGNTIIITNKEKVIKVYGKRYKNLENKNISKDIIKLLSEEALSIQRTKTIKITSDDQIKKQNYYYPIKKNGFNVGSIIVLDDNNLSVDLLDYITELLYKNF